MRIYKLKESIILESDGQYYRSSRHDWNVFINRDDLYSFAAGEILRSEPVSEDWFSKQVPDAPLDIQEVWAAGVTYLRSRDARMEESKDSSGGTFYDKVYEADRPEIFFKATAARVVGKEGGIRIRKDSSWNVPEPELTLFISSSGKIVAYTIGNDMSSRSIEGENPLYLPQAKTYDGSASLGPCLYVPEHAIDENTVIKLVISRKETVVFSDSISINRMKRKHQELVGYLFKECSFAEGVFLMTGTGIVPPSDFTLGLGDQVTISIDHIGVLNNVVTQ